MEPQIYDNVYEICKKQKRSVAEVSREAGLHPKAVAKWNKNIPSVLAAYKMASALNVSIESLLRRKGTNNDSEPQVF